MFFDPETRELLRTRPSPLTWDQARALHGARPAGPPPRPSAEPVTAQRRASNTGVIVVAGQKIALGRIHAGQVVTVHVADHTIDCPDPMKLAAFYSQLTGCPVMEGSGDTMAAISLGDVDLAFQRVEDYRPPRWPDREHPKQYHLDFEVSEIEPEQRRVVELGATVQKDFIGPDGYGQQVFTDPAGHPFCLCRHEGVTWTGGKVEWP